MTFQELSYAHFAIFSWFGGGDQFGEFQPAYRAGQGPPVLRQTNLVAYHGSVGEKKKVLVQPSFLRRRCAGKTDCDEGEDKIEPWTSNWAVLLSSSLSSSDCPYIAQRVLFTLFPIPYPMPPLSSLSLSF